MTADSPTAPARKVRSQRILALDIFRGMTIAFMIIVNTPGNGELVWAPLHHARWHGFTPTDLVFPSFLFAVGYMLLNWLIAWACYKRGVIIKV